MKHFFPIFLILVSCLLLLPALVSARGLIPCGGPGENPCQPCHFILLLVKLINFGVVDIAIPLSTVMVIWAGLLFAFSGGSSDKITKGKKVLTNTLWGLLIVFGAYFTIDTSIKVLTADPTARAFSVSSGGIQFRGQTFGPWNAPQLPSQYGNCSIQQPSRGPQSGSVKQATSSLRSLIQTIAFTFGTIIMGISVIMILYSAWLYMTSAGSEENVTTAKNILIFSLIGVAVALVAFSLPVLIISLLR